MESTSSDDLVAPITPVPGVREATRRSPVDNPDESTVLDLLEPPDNEPTTTWPMLAEVIAQNLPARREGPAPSAVEQAPRARGSSGRLGARRWVGKYELRDKLARGAFGVVFSARDPSLDRDVAIKVLRPNHLTNQVIVQRFLQEARATARIAHPGIVTIHDCGQIDTNLGLTAFIAMELLAGDSLHDRLAQVGRMPPDDAIEIVRQIASALEAAHRADVLHRDLKPDNIFLVQDPAMPAGERVKVLDFGLAKLGDHGHTQLDTVFGTPHYMSPEQTRSAAQVDHRSDIYALGCILFELVTGEAPFNGDLRAIIQGHQLLVARRAAVLVPELAPELDELIAAMLAKDPMARPQTMGAVQRELQRIPAAQDFARAPSQPPAAQTSQAAAYTLPGPPPVQLPRIHAPAAMSTVPSSRPVRALSPPAMSAPLAVPVRPRAALDPVSGVLLVPPSGAHDAIRTATVEVAPPVAPGLGRVVWFIGLGVLIVAAAVVLALATG